VACAIKAGSQNFWLVGRLGEVALVTVGNRRRVDSGAGAVTSGCGDEPVIASSLPAMSRTIRRMPHQPRTGKLVLVTSKADVHPLDLLGRQAAPASARLLPRFDWSECQDGNCPRHSMSGRGQRGEGSGGTRLD